MAASLFKKQFPDHKDGVDGIDFKVTPRRHLRALVPRLALCSLLPWPWCRDPSLLFLPSWLSLRRCCPWC